MSPPAATCCPPIDYLIVDEAHHLESATTNALSFRLTEFDLGRMLKELGGTTSGVLSRLLGETNETLRPSDFGLLQQKVNRATDMAFRLENLNREFFQRTGRIRANSSARDSRPAITPGRRASCLLHAPCPAGTRSK